MPSLEELLEASARSDVAAFRELYRRTAPQLNAIVRAMIGNAAASEDVLQDVYVKVWRHASRYERAKGAAMPWLATVARRAAIDHLRRPSLPTEPIEDEEAIADAVAVEETATDPFAADRLSNCLSRLREDYRLAVTFAYLKGLSYEQLAARLERPVGTVKSWVHRGVAELKVCMA